ncbi:PRC-barrel domain-containing protein [Sulfitobacter aestuarii]|uniref:PRC-barrel domain-containing protein n=1 Tax=Sulfitobacter aestuarii TaxID=2161676 RepID=A0ABW5U3T1_9RHOB
MTGTSSAASMVSSNDVNGTAVYGADGTQVGHIDHLMIDKKSGNVAYAVMGFGGFLGLGEDHHPVPWNALRYDPAREGFVTDITEAQLRDAPDRGDDWQRDRAWEKRTFDHYGVPYYWF